MTKLLTLSLLALLYTFSAYSQEPKTSDTTIAKTTNIPKSDTSQKYSADEVEASFPGGNQGWIKYLNENLNVEVPVMLRAPAGKYVVVITFVVDKDGSIVDVNAHNNPGYGTAEEAVRVFKSSPKWNPGFQNGHFVKSYRTQRITFQVNGR